MELDTVSVLDTETGVWDSDLVDPLPFARQAMGCLATTVDGVPGALVTGGCHEACLVGTRRKWQVLLLLPLLVIVLMFTCSNTRTRCSSSLLRT